MGQLGFVRVYTGELKNGSAVYNSTRNFMEHKIRIFVPHSDELKPTSVVKVINYQGMFSFLSSHSAKFLIHIFCR